MAEENIVYVKTENGIFRCYKSESMHQPIYYTVGSKMNGYIDYNEVEKILTIEDLYQENQELKQVIRKIKETLNDEVKFNYVQEKVDAYGVRTVQKTIKSFVLKEKIEEILKEVE